MQHTHMFRTAVALAGLAAAIPASAVSLSSTAPPQPMPANEMSLAPSAIETWTAGSGALVPLMAADAQAAQAAGVDVPEGKTPSDGKAAGKAVDDVSFVKKATESGRKEVAAARDALPQLKNPGLKQIAEMLVQDHSKANARLSSIAESKGWPVPAPQAAPAPPPAGGAAGDFDQKWTAEMIAGHERSVALYTAQAQGGQDKDLRQYARDTLPTIEHHLAELRKLQK
jgi:putative membrane protein